MYVCLCKGITDAQIREAVSTGAESIREVRDQLGVMSQCGKCSTLAREIVKETLESNVSSNSGTFYEVA